MWKWTRGRSRDRGRKEGRAAGAAEEEHCRMFREMYVAWRKRVERRGQVKDGASLSPPEAWRSASDACLTARLLDTTDSAFQAPLAEPTRRLRPQHPRPSLSSFLSRRPSSCLTHTIVFFPFSLRVHCCTSILVPLCLPWTRIWKLSFLEAIHRPYVSPSSPLALSVMTQGMRTVRRWSCHSVGRDRDC